MKAAPPACAVMGAVEVLKDMNKRQARKVPDVNTRTRLSIGHGWWNWSGPGGHRRNWADYH